MYNIYKITANTTVDFAAEELRKYLRMMMPDSNDIPVNYAPEAKSGFRLGLMSDFGLDVSEAEDVYLDDIIHIDVDAEGNGIIAGSNPRSVLLATYRYLQENGCRWLFPGIDGEKIPIKNIEALKYHKMADCRFRGQCNEGAEIQVNMMEAIDFTPKIGMNIFMLEFTNPDYYSSYYEHTYNPNRERESINPSITLQWKRQCEAEIAKRGLQFHDMGHGWTIEPFGIMAVNDPDVPEDAYQYLALWQGKREIWKNIHPYNTNYCMSNPKAREIVTSSIVSYAKAHTNVDYLHVWLADSWNSHCECEECLKMTPSDWYVIQMNEVDKALTEAGLDTRIVFICYVDTSWPPLEATLVNPKRFSLLVAPVTRDYSYSPEADSSFAEYPPYKRNANEKPVDVNEYVKRGSDWQKKCNVRAFLYEYHFWKNQYYDPGVLDFAKVIHDDVVNYKKNGLNGIIEDGSQRSYFPNGFCFFVYGQTLFDTSLEFEDLKRDYFKSAYGEDYEKVLEIFEKIGKCFDPRYLAGRLSSDLNVGKHYNPAMAENLRKMPEVAKEAADFIAAHRIMPERAQTVMFKILRHYIDYCVGLSRALAIKCMGAGVEAREIYDQFLRDFGKIEAEIQTCYDQYMMGYAMGPCLFYRMENALPAQEDRWNNN